jgi:hypothetical protein
MAQLQIRRKTDLHPLCGLAEHRPASFGNAVKNMGFQLIDGHESFLKISGYDGCRHPIDHEIDRIHSFLFFPL